MSEEFDVVVIGAGPAGEVAAGRLGEAGLREATTATSVPGRLVILGGGVVGVEMAQAWSSLGSRVTLIEMLPLLLPREEPFASAQVARRCARAALTFAPARKPRPSDETEAYEAELRDGGGRAPARPRSAPLVRTR